MSLRTSYSFLSFFFLLTLISCEDPTDIGLNLPGQNQLGTHFERFPAQAATVIHPDSILAFQNEPIAIGKVTDGEFGTITPTHYTEIGLNGTNISFNASNNQSDSLVLVMAYTGYYYGDTTANITVNVLELDESFQENKTYFINSTLKTKGTILGSKTFKPRFNRIKKEVTKDGTKTVVEFSRLLRIPLAKSFGDALVGKTFSTQEDLKAFWKGIAITAASSSATGSIAGFSTFPDSAGIQQANIAGINLYFTDTNGKKQKKNFSFSGTFFNGVEVSRTGDLATLDKPNKELPGQQSNNTAFIQANTGVKTKLTFPNLQDFKNGKGNIYINYAELVIPVKPGTVNANGKVTPAPPSILLYQGTPGNRVVKTTGGTAIAIQTGNSPVNNLTTPAVGLFNKDSLHYKVNITSYVQAVIDQKKPNNGILLTPTPEDKVSALGAGLSYPGTLSLNRALLDATDKKIALRIYYSELK